LELTNNFINNKFLIIKKGTETMKKILLMVATLFTVALTACTSVNTEELAKAKEDSIKKADSIANVQVIADSSKTDSLKETAKLDSIKTIKK
jgi:hypothetical protein